MAKEIDVSRPPTGRGPTKLPDGSEIAVDQARVPAPAKLPAGVVSGNPPLPMGKAVVATDPAKLTTFERQQLEKVGWKSGQPIPDDMVERIAAAELAAAADAGETGLPVSPSTPPVKLETIDLEDMSPEEQQRVQRDIAEVLGAAAPNTAAEPVAKKVVPGRLSEAAQKVMQARQLDMDTPQVARPAKVSIPNTVADSDQKTPIQSYEKNVEGSAGGHQLTHCPHCTWDLADDPIPEPDDSEKELFTHSILGMTNFTKSYSILGDKARLTFRTLSSGEMDAIYKQVQLEVAGGEIVSDADYRERLLRFRLYLQMAEFWSEANKREFPDGLSELTNPNATQFWKSDSKEPLVEIEEWILREVLKTEVLHRVARNICSQFNRLIARLEALVDSPDFWKKTGGQP